MKFLTKTFLGAAIALSVLGLTTNSAEARSRHHHHHDHYYSRDRVVVYRSYPRYYARPVYYGYGYRPYATYSRSYYYDDTPRFSISFGGSGYRHYGRCR